MGATAALALAVTVAEFAPAARAQAAVSDAGPAAAGGYRVGSPAPTSAPIAEIAYSDFIGRIDRDEIREVTIADRTVDGKLANGSAFRTTAPEDPGLIARLLDHRVRITVAQPGQASTWIGWLTPGLSLLMLVGMVGYAMWSSKRQAKGGGRVLGIGRSPAKQAAADAQRVTFQDVAGIEDAEVELREIVEFLKGPEKFRRLGGKIPKGCLLAGPPGTGKTLLARAMAGEAGVPFFSISGSAFVEMFVGVGASRVRDMFEQAKKNAPCIIFIDEIDAVGRHRATSLGGGNDERDQTLNQLLVEMDGFDANQGVIVVAATNRPDVLDPALLRPGRFDRQVAVSAPDVAGREKILRVHLRGVPLAPEVDPKLIARATPGFSGADLANLVNEAALLAARHDAERLSPADLEDARDKVLMGAERRSLVMTAGERLTTAYHESGHALVALHTPGCDPLHKVSIVPRGRALGVTMSLPERDRYGLARIELEAKIAMMFGGRVAEELIFGKERITTGASDDIRQATALARRMVTEFGFSDRLGPLSYGEGDQHGFLGHGSSGRGNVSEATARIIDEETRRLVEDGEARARSVLAEHADQLRRLAEALLEHETLSGEAIRALLDVAPADLAAACASELALAAAVAG
ncbi:cell division protein FtsH [Phenylobacterium soli]|uniref:ATP-dependent zinc metalloprotease FtsH n=2 Tax=Phenylobacterium soli TaxID=2170551 RepID=A0A328AJ86_9CAUL|nr:cell division protein FtsH [Phenylobacterium soli]